MSDRERGKYLAVRYYQKKNRRKLRAFNHDFPLPEYFRELIGDKKSVVIADIGAGSIPTTGNSWPGVEVKIVASDLLADEYNEMWRNDRRVILNPVEKQDMEALTYPDNTFDIVHCVNALDHSEHPDKAIREMIRVCKPGGWVYLRHLPNEGRTENYQGFHQWNIDILDGECTFGGKQPGSGFRLLDLGEFVSERKTETSNTMYEWQESIVSRFHKPSLTVSDVERGFRAGERFEYRDGRRVIAVHEPGYFVGEDEDSLLVQLEGVDYGGDYWDEVQVGNLRRATHTKSYLMAPEANLSNRAWATPEGLLDGERIVGNEVVNRPPERFRKYEKSGDYHWKQYQAGTKYRRHADRIALWVREELVLDIGAGDGMITSLLGDFAVGIDNEPEGVRLARAHGVNVILGDAYRLDYEDGLFESVLMADVLEHFEFPEKALAEARRVLTKYIYITTPPKRPDGKLTDKYHFFELTPEELKTLVEACGFVLEGEILSIPVEKVMYGRFRKDG